METSPFPIDTELTGVALSYPQGRLIADRVLPRLPGMAGEKFKWNKWTKSESFTIPDTKVGRKSAPNEIEFTAEEVLGQTEDYGLDDFIPLKDLRQAAIRGNTFRIRARAVTGLTRLIMLAREVRVANLVFDQAQYAAANKVALVGVNQWNDKTNSDPLDDILTGLDAAFVRPNKMTIGREPWSKLISHPKIATATGAATKSSGIVRMEQIQELFELDEINVGESRLNTAKKGQPEAYARVWGKHCLLHWTDEMVQDTEDEFITFGFTAVRELGNGVDRVAGSIDDPKRGLEGGETVRVGEAVDEVIAAADVAFFIENAVA